MVANSRLCTFRLLPLVYRKFELVPRFCLGSVLTLLGVQNTHMVKRMLALDSHVFKPHTDEVQLRTTAYMDPKVTI